MFPLHGVDLGWRLGNKAFHGSTLSLQDMEKNPRIQEWNCVASSLYVGLSHDIGDTQAGYTQSGYTSHDIGDTQTGYTQRLSLDTVPLWSTQGFIYYRTGDVALT